MAHRHETRIGPLDFDQVRDFLPDVMEAYFETLTKKGKELYASYKNATAGSTTSDVKLGDLYWIESGDVNFPDLERETLDPKYLPLGKVFYIDIFNLSKKMRAEPIYSNRYDTNKGTWLIWSANKSEDKSAAPLWPSDICWKSWSRANEPRETEKKTTEEKSTEEKTGSLKNIVIWFIQNTLTRVAIWQAERASSHSGVSLARGYREYTDRDDGFFAILGSPLGSCVLRMLTEHKAELMNQRIEKVVVLGVDENHDLGDFARARSVVIELSRHQDEEGKGVANSSG